MSQLNTGPTVARARVSVITLFGLLLVGLALVSALPGGATSAGGPSSGKANSASPNEMCGQVVPSPNQGTGNNWLQGVAAVAADDVWAVGYYRAYIEGPYQTLIEHWNGSSWAVVPSPNPGTGWNQLWAVAAIAANDVWAVGSYQTHADGPNQTLVEHWNGSAWAVVPSPNPGAYYNILYGVAAVAANDVWAVGAYDSPRQTLVEHWNGSAWAVVPSPNPGTYDTYLNGVAAVAANDVWAVGYYYDGSTDRTLVEHWNGTAWSMVTSPNRGTSNNHLYGVAAVAANDVWAVGSGDGTLIEHWNGSVWAVVPDPSPGGALYGVAAVAANDVWAVGYYCPSQACETLIEHWNGYTWTVVTSPDVGTYYNYLNGVAAVAANDVWAVGYYEYPAQTQTLAEQWNGTEWSVIPSPNQGTGFNYLNGVAAVAANDVWAVGYYSSNYIPRTLVEHWNGSVWAVVPDPSPGGALYGVVAVAANDVWAVGYAGAQTLVEHWNGTAWTIVPSPNPNTDGNQLYGVAAVAANDVWAVGYYFGGGRLLTLVEHWNGTTWTIVPSPNPNTDENHLYGVAAVAANDVWAVGSYNSGAVGDYGGVLYGGTLVEHWNGTAWTIVPAPSPGAGGTLNGVVAVSANDVWAVGYYSSNYIPRTLVEHWNGTAWSVVPSPDVGTYYNYLNEVAAVAANDVWAVGDYSNVSFSTGQTLVEHWNGSAWALVPSPNHGTDKNYLNGVAAASANDVWAVGSFNNEGVDQTLVEEFVPCASPSPTGTATGAPISTASVTPNGTATSCPIQFSDVPPGSIFYPFIHCLACRGIIGGYPDGSFKSGNNVTRGQLAKIVSNAAGFNDAQNAQMFQDVPMDSAFFQYIGRLASRGYMSGYQCGEAGEPCAPPANLPYFRPNNKASRGQLTKIVSNAAGFQDSIPTSVQTFTDVPPNSTFWVYVERLLLNRPGVMGGYPCGGANEPCDPQQRPYFRPGSNVTRGQTSKIVANTFFPGCQSTEGREK